MLVLTRKQGEKIIADGGIEISVLRISGSRVKIGIKAPADCSIQRGETVFDMEFEEEETGSFHCDGMAIA